jgi:hypothetical protein
MERPTQIPLFPLDVVLLPNMPLPLHIFEPRYKTMVRRCLDEKLEFGMILAANQSVASVGCSAEIIRKVRDYPDGRMDILTEGRAIFHLDELLDEKEYYEGRVEYLHDGPYLRDAEKESQLIAGFAECHLLLTGRPWSGGPTTNSHPSHTTLPRSFPWNWKFARRCSNLVPKASAATSCFAGSRTSCRNSRNISARKNALRAMATQRRTNRVQRLLACFASHAANFS